MRPPSTFGYYKLYIEVLDGPYVKPNGVARGVGQMGVWSSKATTPSSKLSGRTDRIQEESTENANATPNAFKTITHSVYTCPLAAFKTSKK